MKNQTITRTIHGFTVMVDADNKLYFQPKTKVFRKNYIRADFGKWEEDGLTPIKPGTISLSAFRALVVKKDIIVQRDGKEFTL